jgi:nucleoside-diphosphate-sugar epimerase
MLAPSPLLVTGITGHSGRLFADRLARERYSGTMRFALRPSSDESFLGNTSLNCSRIVGDITDPSYLDGAMEGVGTALHIAGIEYSRNIVDAAIRKNVQWVVLVHTTGRYSRYKSAAEEYVRTEDAILAMRDQIAITVLRPTMIYGSSRDRNMFKLIDYLYRHKLFPVFGSGKNLMQPVLAADLGNAYYDVLANHVVTVNREYNLSGKEPISYIDLVRTVSRTLRKSTVLVRLPIWLSVLGARVFNLAFQKAPISVEQVLRMNEDRAFPHEPALRDFGYRPASFEDGIRGEVEEYLRRLDRGHHASRPSTGLGS